SQKPAVGIAGSVAWYVLPRATHEVWQLLSAAVVDGPPAPSPISVSCRVHAPLHHGDAMAPVCYLLFPPRLWGRPPRARSTGAPPTSSHSGCHVQGAAQPARPTHETRGDVSRWSARTRRAAIVVIAEQEDHGPAVARGG